MQDAEPGFGHHDPEEDVLRQVAELGQDIRTHDEQASYFNGIIVRAGGVVVGCAGVSIAVCFDKGVEIVQVGSGVGVGLGVCVVALAVTKRLQVGHQFKQRFMPEQEQPSGPSQN